MQSGLGAGWGASTEHPGEARRNSTPGTVTDLEQGPPKRSACRVEEIPCAYFPSRLCRGRGDTAAAEQCSLRMDIHSRRLEVSHGDSLEHGSSRASPIRSPVRDPGGMSRTRSRLASLCFALCLGLAAGVVTGCDDDDASSRLHMDLQSIIEDAVSKGVTPGVSLAVASDEGSTWLGAAGVGDVERNQPMSAQHRFRAGSILKTLVATAVLQAVEQGTLALEDTLTERLPASVTDRIENAQSITVAMLLAHRSGIPEWVTDETNLAIMADPEHLWTLEEILGIAGAQPSAFPPGSGYGYSNTNYVLLGEILSAAEGRSWRAIVRERVIERAGLSHTRLPEPGDLDCPAPCARGYVPLDEGLADLTVVDPSMAGASGGHALETTVSDLLTFWKKLRAGALFERKQTLESMLAFQPAPEPESRLVGYGLGVMQLDSRGVVAVGHLGTTAGYQSFMLYVPKTGRYITGNINVMGDLAAVLVPIMDRAGRP
ncbi:class A beta-lactamase-related serine hydrolase [Corallococcus praedator]|uniref:Class A beta-lactamase-related serine hydrolase n=2 Tax=Myxococcaceae TaxID=31 RepID=A0ABX9QA32_9BACT|nr:class A beta-lactamase-related serine hydrolase [Corallococcus sp. CA031C]RKH97821.1 class A beta-lactamase-related serine hydrolase [Corallococcus praedator]